VLIEAASPTSNIRDFGVGQTPVYASAGHQDVCSAGSDAGAVARPIPLVGPVTSAVD
jgi:hypothetical protein